MSQASVSAAPYLKKVLFVEEQRRERPPSIFLCYASSDRSKVENVVANLQQSGANIWFDAWRLEPGDSIAERVERAASSSDVFLVFLSQASTTSRWVSEELNRALSREMNDRAITIVPVLLDDCEIPSALADRQYLDLRGGASLAIEQFFGQIGRAEAIDPSQLDPRTFEMLVRDLFLAQEYSVTDQTKSGKDDGIDLIITRTNSEQSSPTSVVTWIVQVKAYKERRVSLESVRQLLGALGQAPPQTKGMLVTSGHLTSVAREFLNEALVEATREVRVIDGSELKNMLLQQPGLVTRYFPQGPRL